MDLRGFDAAMAQAAPPEATFAALQDYARALVGAKLFTVMLLDEAAGVSSRVHTSHPRDYPTSGTKPINRTHWFDIVHGEKRPFVANTIGEIADVFPDHAQIDALGCQSVVNLPILINGAMVGTVNMLDVDGFYTDTRLRLIKDALAPAAKLAYLMWKQRGGTLA